MSTTAFEKGDFVRFIRDEEVKPNAFGNKINVYQIKSIEIPNVFLVGIDEPVPLVKLSAININGTEDRWIYYVPIRSATYVFGSDVHVPALKSNYAYYLSELEVDIKESVSSFKYVHEIQHYLRKTRKDTPLIINNEMWR